MVVDVGQCGSGRAGGVDDLEAAPLPKEAVDGAGGIQELAHDLSAVVDAGGLGVARAGGTDPDKPSAVQHEAVPLGLGSSNNPVWV